MQNLAGTLLEAIGHQQAARFAEAESLYTRILADVPDEPQANYLYGLLQLRTGRGAAATLALARAVALRPGHLDARLSLGGALLDQGKPAQALEAADAVLAARPDHAQALFLRGTALGALDRPAEAAAALFAATRIDPGHAVAWLHLANALTDLDRLDDAAAACRAAIARAPTLVEAQVSLGFILASRGELPAAVAACKAAIALRPDCVQAHWNLAVAALLGGDYARGFAEYEWRKRHDRFRQDFLDLPGTVWTGEELSGRTILVHAEQGLGDTIQFARYLPLLAARGARVVLACDARLAPWLALAPGVASVVPRGATLPAYDFWIDQMSLPLVFGTTPDTIPLPGGYLAADPAKACAWWARLPAGRKIGLVWAGNPLHSNDRRRSLPAAQAAALCALPGATFISLQVGPRAGETGLTDLSAGLADFAGTAALITNLDLVITVDTAVAHVAGALGVPCWVMLPYAPDWRWGLGGGRCAWYRSLRLFRQPRPGDWPAVITQVGEALTNWLAL